MYLSEHLKTYFNIHVFLSLYKPFQVYSNLTKSVQALKMSFPRLCGNAVFPKLLGNVISKALEDSDLEIYSSIQQAPKTHDYSKW